MILKNDEVKWSKKIVRASEVLFDDVISEEKNCEKTPEKTLSDMFLTAAKELEAMKDDGKILTGFTMIRHGFDIYWKRTQTSCDPSFWDETIYKTSYRFEEV